ncbi:hypothetical protein ZIOFF_032797 [Zingiber officinale]|uniref:Uncharacterized protein n=1 Tax=Zingiber officinale TaxID=94328 RepID=A0A8J5GP78_ZINOF|nr:hypothetical protein ZIOFF_032797 [Zingiber officinale]
MPLTFCKKKVCLPFYKFTDHLPCAFSFYLVVSLSLLFACSDESDRDLREESMSRKRKSDASGLDEADRTLYSTFCGAANSLSQLYTQAMNQQKVSFQAGERHALHGKGVDHLDLRSIADEIVHKFTSLKHKDKLYQWVMRKHEEGSRITVADIVCHIQTEMDHVAEDGLTAAPRAPFQNQQPPPSTHPINSTFQAPSGLFGQPIPRSGHTDQAKNSVFSNALSSPVRRSLQPYHLANDGSGFYTNDAPPTGNAASRNHDSDQNRDTSSLSCNDTSMDIHTDSPPHQSYS